MRFVRCKTTSGYEAMILTPEQAYAVLLSELSQASWHFAINPSPVESDPVTYPNRLTPVTLATGKFGSFTS
jgi:hypothetical protein